MGNAGPRSPRSTRTRARCWGGGSTCHQPGGGGGLVASGQYASLRCPAGSHPNTGGAAARAQCLGGAFDLQSNDCVTDPAPAWFTPGRIVGLVFGLLALAAVPGYLLLYSPEKRKGRKLVKEVELHELLLGEAEGNLEEANALNTRMLEAWRIAEADITLGKEIAAGGFGIVYAGSYAGLRVAVKVLKSSLDEELSPDVSRDFARECETLMAIRHPSLLVFYGAGITVESKPFMVTEFMARGSLKTVLADRRQELTWPVRRRIALQIAKAVEYLHVAGIVHRDLKSDNCLVNNSLDVKVCDFGTSKLLTAGRSRLQATAFDRSDGPASEALTATMTKGVGTILWMAPELFIGGTKYGPEVDVYSFGMILWELATRQIPWDHITEPEFIRFYGMLSAALKSEQRPTIPADLAESQPGFVALMQRCWTTAPRSRPVFADVVLALVEVDNQLSTTHHLGSP